MARELLVLGGSGFVGRALVSEGLATGFEVTTFNRGQTGPPAPEVRALHGDRHDRASLAQVADRDWDLVIDTWSGAPCAVRDSARALRDRTRVYAYISSESVYAPPPPRGVAESADTVPASPDALNGTYPELKRGAEIALEQAFGGRTLLARAGLILGPHENVGRLTWWLSRMARGGEILCPGPAELPIQYVDARDLAGFVITAAGAGHTGAFNVVARRGHSTMGSVLEACRRTSGAGDAVLTWVDPDAIAASGIEPWDELPIWIPPGHEFSGMHDANVERAHHAGLRCRPVIDTVSDTWRWLTTLDGKSPVRAGLPHPGLEAGRERDALNAWRPRD
jgi:2'-hydroxyisoflavone reductase